MVDQVERDERPAVRVAPEAVLDGEDQLVHPIVVGDVDLVVVQGVGEDPAGSGHLTRRQRAVAPHRVEQEREADADRAATDLEQRTDHQLDRRVDPAEGLQDVAEEVLARRRCSGDDAVDGLVHLVDRGEHVVHRRCRFGGDGDEQFRQRGAGGDRTPERCGDDRDRPVDHSHDEIGDGVPGFEQADREVLDALQEVVLEVAEHVRHRVLQAHRDLADELEHGVAGGDGDVLRPAVCVDEALADVLPGLEHGLHGGDAVLPGPVEGLVEVRLGEAERVHRPAPCVAGEVLDLGEDRVEDLADRSGRDDDPVDDPAERPVGVAHRVADELGDGDARTQARGDDVGDGVVGHHDQLGDEVGDGQSEVDRRFEQDLERVEGDLGEVDDEADEGLADLEQRGDELAHHRHTRLGDVDDQGHDRTGGVDQPADGGSDHVDGGVGHPLEHVDDRLPGADRRCDNGAHRIRGGVDHGVEYLDERLAEIEQRLGHPGGHRDGLGGGIGDDLRDGLAGFEECCAEVLELVDRPVDRVLEGIGDPVGDVFNDVDDGLDRLGDRVGDVFGGVADPVDHPAHVPVVRAVLAEHGADGGEPGRDVLHLAARREVRRDHRSGVGGREPADAVDEEHPAARQSGCLGDGLLRCIVAGGGGPHHGVELVGRLVDVVGGRQDPACKAESLRRRVGHGELYGGRHRGLVDLELADRLSGPVVRTEVERLDLFQRDGHGIPLPDAPCAERPRWARGGGSSHARREESRDE